MLKIVFRLTLSLAVSFAMLALLLQLVNSGVSDLDRPSVLNSLKNIDTFLLSLYFGISLVTLGFRAYRYQLLIMISGEEKVPSFKQMLVVTGIRNMVVDMLPARLGELGYVGILNRGYGVKIENCVSSLAISIAFDFIAVLMVVILIVCKQFLGGDLQGWAVGAMLMAVVVSGVAFAGLFIIAPWVNAYIANRFPAQTTGSLWGKCLGLANDFCSSLETARLAGKTLTVMALSLMIRALKYIGLYCLFQAITTLNFSELAALPIEHTVGALIGGEIGASLPIPTFMSFGAYEAGSALVFQLLGVSNQAAAFVTMLCVHIWSQILDYTLGGLFLIWFINVMKKDNTMNVRFLNHDSTRSTSSFNTTNTRTFKTASVMAVICLFMLGGAFLAHQLWQIRKLGSITPPAPGVSTDNTHIGQNLPAKQATALHGFVVFSSNRNGNHDLFKLDLNTQKLSKLTRHPHAETYPRISPDGRHLVFSRAHQPWVSQRNTQAWDVYLLDLETLEEQKIASNATAPAWASQTLISVVQESTALVLFNVASGVSNIVYQTGVNNAMPAGANIQNAKYNALSGEVAFTARQSDIKMNKGHWGTAIASGNSHRGIHNGCELSWGYDQRLLFQVHPDTGINGSNRIVSVNKTNLELTTLIDLKGEFTHEYWPQQSSNGEYMVFGASRSKKEHEHDVADYEIFLWKVGRPAHEATRLTFHTGNDNWPDVFIQH